MPLSEVITEWEKPRPTDRYDRFNVLPLAENMRTGQLSLGFPKVAVGLAQAIQLPGRVMRGEVSPTSDEAIRHAVNLASGAVGGTLAAPAVKGAAVYSGFRRVPPYKRRASTKKDVQEKMINTLSTGRDSQIFREDLGEITIRLGTPGDPNRKFRGGTGLSHIEARRPIRNNVDGRDYIRESLVEILTGGKLKKFESKDGHRRRAVLENKTDQAIVRMDRDGKPEKWLLTGYPKDKKK